MSSSWIPPQAGGSWGGGEPPVGAAAPGPVTSPLTAPMPAAPWSDGPGQDGVAPSDGAPPPQGQPPFYPGAGGGDGESVVSGVSTLQRLAMQVTLALFSVVVIAPWAFFTWVVAVTFGLVGAAEPLEDMGGFEESVYYSGATWALLVVGVLAVWRVRTVLVDLRERSRLTAERLADPAGAVTPKPRSTWKKVRVWLPSRGSWLAILALAFSGLAWLVVLEAATEGRAATGALGATGVALLLMPALLALVWLPWKMMQWATALIGWIDRTGQRSQYRCGLMMGGLLMGLLTLNPLVLPVTLGMTASAISGAVMEEVRGGAPTLSTGPLRWTGVVLAQVRPRAPAGGSGQLAQSRELLMNVGRTLPFGAEPESSIGAEATVDQCFRYLGVGHEFEQAMNVVHRSGIYHPADEDIVHAVVLRVCERHSESPISEFGPYFNRSLRNAIVDYLRNRNRWAPLPEEIADYSGDAESRFVAGALLERMRTMVDGQSRTILERMIEQETPEQIRQALGLTPDAYRQAESRMKRQLRAALGHH